MIGINTRQATTEYRLARWAQIVQARVSSGQSIKAFCTSEGISKNTYFYWQRKLREVACTEIAEQDAGNGNAIIPSGLGGHSTSCSPMPPGWTRMEQSVPIESSREGASLTIDVNGCRVSVDSDPDLELLSKVCRALKAL